MAKKADSKGEDLTELPGVGAATARKLQAAGLNTVAKIAKAGKSGLEKAGLSKSIAAKLAVTVAKNKAKSTAKSVTSKAKEAAKKASSSTKKATSKAKETAKKAATSTKKAASKATAAGKKVAEKTVEKAKGDHKVKSEKSDDGRKGKTLKVPRSVADMPWFRKN